MLGFRPTDAIVLQLPSTMLLIILYLRHSHKHSVLFQRAGVGNSVKLRKRFNYAPFVPGSTPISINAAQKGSGTMTRNGAMELLLQIVLPFRFSMPIDVMLRV